MISIYNIKPQFQRLLTPILEFLHRKKVTANQITVSACILSLLIGVLFWFSDYCRWLLLALPVGLFVRMALNALDGMMARRYNLMSLKGEMLNEVGDIVSDLFVFFPLLKFLPQSTYWVALFIALSIINEFAGVMGKVIAGERRYEGPMGKSDRAFLLGLYGVLALCGVNIAPCADWIFAVLVLLLVLSTGIRISKTLRKASNTPRV